jgi:hypothetical protein
VSDQLHYLDTSAVLAWLLDSRMNECAALLSFATPLMEDT